MKRLIMLILVIIATQTHAVVDLHTHFASHIPYGFMLFGGTPADQPPATGTWKDKHQQQMYRDWLVASGIKIFVDAALVNIFQFDKEGAKKQVLQQFEYTANFIANNSDVFSLAKTPEEASKALDAGKIVFVRALEGAEFLVSTEEDLKFWRDQGVAMIGPIHLVDNMYGDASIMTGFTGILNPLGLYRSWFDPTKRQGLTADGKKAIRGLLEHGIIVDMAHMSMASTDQSIEIHKELNLPPIMSHGYLHVVRSDSRGLKFNHIRDIYELGGLIGITGGSDNISPLEQNSEQKNEHYCEKSIDDYMLHLKKLQALMGNHIPIGWASDANGFVNHFRPKYGEHGCYEMEQTDPNPILTHGMTGLMDLKFALDYIDQRLLKSEGIRNSHLRFLEIWQRLVDFADKKRNLQ